MLIMLSGWAFIVVGVVALLFRHEWNKSSDTHSLKVRSFWEQFEKDYPELLNDAVTESLHDGVGRYRFDMKFLHRLSKTDAYKELSDKQRDALIIDLSTIDDLLKEHDRVLKFSEISFYISMGSFFLFIVTVVGNYLNS